MKNKIIIISIGLLAVLALGFFAQQYGSNYESKKTSPEVVKITNPKDVTYIINGQSTQYFGNEVTHDFDGDGRQDVAFIITQNTGGSGTFYYVVVALNTTNGYVGSGAFLLGDRITPQTTEMSQNPSTPDVVVVNYADRKPEEAFTVQPSVGKSVWLKFDPKTMQFGEVVQNFEGEANPASMTLDMKTWSWIRTTYNNDSTVTPKTVGRFTFTFKKDKTFSITTDCNSIGGEYSLSGKKIVLNRMISTMMACQDSQEQDFKKMLDEIQNYMFTSKGELVFGLNYDSGSMIFK